mmetsp:Transcript_23968/g.35447  ORF Transcript_23968/g.35447 Transcript_23968/m.35447 type:complete len:139 (+) Transcript_23968:96-512(+)
MTSILPERETIFIIPCHKERPNQVMWSDRKRECTAFLRNRLFILNIPSSLQSVQHLCFQKDTLHYQMHRLIKINHQMRDKQTARDPDGDGKLCYSVRSTQRHFEISFTSVCILCADIVSLRLKRVCTASAGHPRFVHH